MGPNGLGGRRRSPPRMARAAGGRAAWGGSRGALPGRDLQTEASIVGNLVFPLILERFGTEEQKRKFMDGAIAGESGFGFNLTEPAHGSDGTWLGTRGVPDGGGSA